jgi:hypothetical protein
MIEDLTMLANLPVCEDEAADKEREENVPDNVPIATAQSEADKAAAGETMPPPKEKDRTPEDNTKAERVARRGQDAPEQEAAGEEDRG